MAHQPTFADVATDFKRAIYASFSKEGFKGPNAKAFLDHGLKTLSGLQKSLPPEMKKELEKVLKKALDEKASLSHRQEDLLLAAAWLERPS